MTQKKKKLMKKLKKEKTRCEIDEKNKSLKRKKQLDTEKIEEKEVWGRLNELNQKFPTINNIKKKQAKSLQDSIKVICKIIN